MRTSNELLASLREARIFLDYALTLVDDPYKRDGIKDALKRVRDLELVVMEIFK